MRARLVPALVALAVLGTGCSDGGDGEVSPTLPPITDAPSPSPTALALPSEATAATPEGAAEFGTFFYESIDRAFQQRDAGTLKAISSPDCELCQTYIESVERLVDRDERVEGGAITVRDAVPPAASGPTTTATVLYDNTLARRLDAEGSVILEEPAREGVLIELVLVRNVAQPAPDGCVFCDKRVEVEGAGASLDVGGTRPASDVVPGRGSPATHGEAPGRRQWKTLDERMAPACPGNSFGVQDALCLFAVASCPADDQIRWWIWQQETQHTRDDLGNEMPPVVGEWTQLPGTYCLGPDDPGVPTIGRVIAQVQAEFRNLPLPVAGVLVAPVPTTLVNIPTAFFAGGAQSATFNPTIVGTSVTINAKPASWSWTWGDGTTQTTTTLEDPKRPVVAHEYRRARDYSVSVATTWTGTFSVAGSAEVFPIRTPAVVQSAPVIVQVREARSQLIDG